ncbi:MAG TPA: lysylphosphatidylglycerol synthase domain-containing protein, partial [Frankiaceae bacterium]|nr:lysylphosphatidylglycerol synthase domain-containing protein [Frankiaceae bacterium]
MVFLAFLAGAVARQRDDIREAAQTLSVWTVLLSFVPALLAIFCSMLSWRAVLADLGSPLPTRVALRIFFIGQLGKYVPGTVWPLLVQMELGRDHKVPRSRTAAAGVVAVALGLTSALVVVALTLPFLGDGGKYVGALAVLPFAVVGLHPRVLTPVMNRGLRLIRRQPLDRPLTARGILRGVGWAGACWLLIGAHVWVLARGLGADESGLRLYAICLGAYTLGWAA